MSIREQPILTDYVNLKLRAYLAELFPALIFGQNIIAGSRLSGLGKDLESIPNVTAFNSTNSENGLFGVAFGAALKGVASIFLMKQLDFSILGLDQMANSYNVIRKGLLKSPVILLTSVVDGGFEGPQASMNSLNEIASLTGAETYFLNCKESIDKAFLKAKTPAFYIMVMSQRLAKNPLFDFGVNPIEYPEGFGFIDRDSQIEHSSKGCVVFYGVNTGILNKFLELNPSLASFDTYLIHSLNSEISTSLINAISKYESIVIIDESKARMRYSEKLVNNLLALGRNPKYLYRQDTNSWTDTNDDEFPFTLLKNDAN